jgi:type II secretory pathway component PulL
MWWQYVIMAVVAIVVVYAFVSLTRFQTRRLSRKTDRTAEDMYDSYADSPGKQRRYARRRGGEWRNE